MKKRDLRRVLPGFGLTLGITLSYLSLLVLIPLSALLWKTFSLSPAEFWKLATSPRSMASYRISFGGALIAAVVDTALGFLVAWVLARYRFPGRRFLDALVDLPFALPTAVAGIALANLYAESGWMGKLLAPLGIQVAYTPLGIILAMSFISFPFVVRTVQPVMEELDPEVEEASAILGAGRWVSFFRVILPALTPSIFTGFALALARAIGEYGSIVFISSNMPLKTEITPLLIITQLEQYHYAAATAIGVVMLGLSFLMLFVINLGQAWARRHHA